MAYETVTLEVSDGIATLTLNRPQVLNAINRKMAAEWAQALEEVKQNSEAKVLVLTGAGRAFCSGADVKEMSSIHDAFSGRSLLKSIHRTIAGLANLEKPVIAAVNGIAAGGGCNLALACDIVIAADTAQFAEIFVRVGLIPDMGGMYYLPRLVGLARAKELMFSGDIIDAKEAERIGMINRAVPAQELVPTVRELAGKIARGPSLAIALTKDILNRSSGMDFATLLAEEAFAQGLAFETKDYEEGVKAFLEKRQPNFMGI